jgi:hypothetical protein
MEGSRENSAAHQFNPQGDRKMSINTTGALRKFVANAMTEVMAGNMDIDKANVLVKMASKVNDSLFAEAKIQKLLLENGREVGRLGTQTLGDPDDERKKVSAAA